MSVWVRTAPILISHFHSSCLFEFEFWGLHLYRTVIILSVWVWVGTAPISIDHSSSCQFQLEFGAAPISIGHLPIISMLVWVGVAPILIDHVPNQFVFSLSWDYTYIDRSFIILSVSVRVWGRTYINRPSSYHFHVSLSFEFEFLGVAPISIGYIPINLCSVWVRTTPILIGHLSCQFEFWVWVFGTAPISIDHSSCQFEFWVWVGTAPILIGHSSCQFEFNLSQDRTYIGRSSFVSVWVFSLSFQDRTYIDQ